MILILKYFEQFVSIYLDCLSCIHVCTLSEWLWSDRHFFRPVNCYVLCLKLCVLLKIFFGSLASLVDFGTSIKNGHVLPESFSEYTLSNQKSMR